MKVGTLADLAIGQMKAVEMGDQRVVLLRLHDGSVEALEDRCSHAEVRLSEGEFDGAEVECPAHGARFCAKTGKQLCMPAVVPVKHFSVRVEGDDIFVEDIK